MVQPRDWKVPLLEDDFSKDAFSSSKKAFNSLEDAYKRLSDEIPLLPNKGDIQVGIGSALTDVLSVGSDGTYLTCDSTEAKGMKWATIAPGDEAFPAGTKLWFYQNTAPTYWTIDSTPADALLAVKGGTAAFNVSGGTQAGTWTQPNHDHTVGNHTHSVSDHTHSQSGHVHQVYNQVASDAHDQIYDSSGAAANLSTVFQSATSKKYILVVTSGTEEESNKVGPPDWFTCKTISASNTGSGGSGTTGSGGAESTSSGATANTWRPLAQVGIICTKD